MGELLWILGGLMMDPQCVGVPNTQTLKNSKPHHTAIPKMGFQLQGQCAGGEFWSSGRSIQCPSNRINNFASHLSLEGPAPTAFEFFYSVF